MAVEVDSPLSEIMGAWHSVHPPGQAGAQSQAIGQGLGA